MAAFYFSQEKAASRFASEDAAPTDEPSEELGDGSKTVRPVEKQDDKMQAQEIFAGQKGSDLYKFPATPEHQHSPSADVDQENDDDEDLPAKTTRPGEPKAEPKKSESPAAATPKEEPKKKAAAPTEAENVSEEVLFSRFFFSLFFFSSSPPSSSFSNPQKKKKKKKTKNKKKKHDPSNPFNTIANARDGQQVQP